MTSPKDDPDVIMFMARFQELRARIDDNPDRLALSDAEDAALARLCLDVCDAAANLASKERSHPQLFAAPVDPGFIATWRDYEIRYSWPLTRVSLKDAFDVDIGPRPEGRNWFEGDSWKRANDAASSDAHAISEAIKLAEIEADPANDGFHPDRYLEGVMHLA